MGADSRTRMAIPRRLCFVRSTRLSERFSPWVYMVPKWQHEAFMTDPEKLMEKPDKGQQGKPEDKG